MASTLPLLLPHIFRRLEAALHSFGFLGSGVYMFRGGALYTALRKHTWSGVLDGIGGLPKNAGAIGVPRE